MQEETGRAGRPQDAELMHLALGMDALFRGDWERSDRELSTVAASAGDNSALNKSVASSIRGLVGLGRRDVDGAVAIAEQALRTSEFIGRGSPS